MRIARLIFRCRKSVPYADPLHAGRHPFQTYLLVLCVISGVPLVFERPPPALSIESLLPAWVAIGWGCALIGGAVLALVGSYWPRSNYATALTLERIGLVLTGPAGLMYGAAILLVVGFPGFVAACIVFGFGAACIKRAHDIGIIIVRATPGHPLVVQREDEGEAAAVLRDDEDES